MTRPFPIEDLGELGALRFDPPALGALASAASEAHFGVQTELRVATEPPFPALAPWPDPSILVPGQCMALPIDTDEAGASAWLGWLERAAEEGPSMRIAPFTTEAAGTFRLWAIGAARLRLRPDQRVEARHDLIGIRLAQIALRFGADTLAGPVEEDRHLPLAGVTRPNETTRAGLEALVELAGRRPQWIELTPPPLPHLATRMRA